jgi:malonate transporter and related proteins
MSAVFAALLPVFLLIALGYLLRRYLLTEEAHWIGLERLVYFVLFPALLVLTLARANLNAVPIGGTGGALMLAVLTMGALCLLVRPVLGARLGVDGPAFTSIFQGATRWQTFVALAVAGNLYGDIGIALASVAMVAMIPLLNVMSVTVLARYARPQRLSFPKLLLTVARNPFIWACVVGLGLNVLQVPLHRTLVDFTDALGRSALAIGLLVVGAGLQLQQLAKPTAPALLTVALKLVVMPAIAVGFALLFQLTGPSLAVVGCCASVPAASNAYVLAREMGGDAPLLAQVLTLQTLAALVTMPVIIALLT